MLRAPSSNLPTENQHDDDCWSRLFDILTTAEQVVTTSSGVSGVHPLLYENLRTFDIPEPTPIHPRGIQKVVSQTSFLRTRQNSSRTRLPSIFKTTKERIMG